MGFIELRLQNRISVTPTFDITKKTIRLSGEVPQNLLCCLFSLLAGKYYCDLLLKSQKLLTNISLKYFLTLSGEFGCFPYNSTYKPTAIQLGW